MRRKSAPRFSSSTLDIPHITKTLPRINPRPFKKQPVMPKPTPPSEEMVTDLNTIGKEYPFCVYYKQKQNDPL